MTTRWVFQVVTKRKDGNGQNKTKLFLHQFAEPLKIETLLRLVFIVILIKMQHSKIRAASAMLFSYFAIVFLLRVVDSFEPNDKCIEIAKLSICANFHMGEFKRCILFQNPKFNKVTFQLVYFKLSKK